MLKIGKRFKAIVERLIGRDTIILFPSYMTVAPEHNIPLVYPIGMVLCGVWNISEFPVTQVPLGLNTEGLPLGVQVVSNHGNDYLTIGVAQELEKKFGGWVPPK